MGAAVRILVSGVFSLVLVASASAQCLFVNTNSDPNTVAAFAVNPDGSLTAVAGSPFATGGSGAFDAAVGSAGLCAGNSRLYVTNPSSDNVSGFDVAGDCTLTPVPGSPFAAGSRALGVDADPSGNFLYVTNFLGDSISVFAMGVDGSLTSIAGSPFATPSTPFDIKFDPAGGRFFVSHDFAAAVGAYLTAPDGTFTPAVGSPFAAGGFEHGIALNPGASRLYAADFGPDTISGFSIGAGAVLTPLGGSPWPAGVEPIDLIVDPSDSFAYATNDNGAEVAGYAIDGSGALTPLPGSPFASDASGPAGLAQDPMGDFLYVANGGFGGSPDVSVFAVAVDGSIAPIAGSPFATGGTGNATGIVYMAAGEPADVSGTKVASGTFVPDGTVVYAITLSNAGPGDQGDNAGHEFIDVLPSQMVVFSATVVSGGGTAVVDGLTNTVTWDGAILAGGSVVIEIVARIGVSVGIGTTISNEGQIFYDSTGDGINDMMRGTYPPGGPTAGAPTDIQVGVPPSIVPTTNDVGRAALFLILVGTPLWLLRRRRLAPVRRGR